MYITIINDCQSQNDIARQETRLISLFGEPVTFVGVSSDFSVNATLEAAGTLVDVLDAAEDREGVVILNVAPRGEQKKDGANGTAFGYFRYRNTLVIATIRGHSLSLIKKLGLVKSIALVSVEKVCEMGERKGWLTQAQSSYIPTSQFRSYDFVPRLAFWLYHKKVVPHETHDLTMIKDAPDCVWYVDAFGNCKTTYIADDMHWKVRGQIVTNVGTFRYYARLKDLSKGETALYSGSSGVAGKRFVELATQMTAGSAAQTLNLHVGSLFELLT